MSLEFPALLECRYELQKGTATVQGSGRTVSMSSTEVCFECDTPVPEGATGTVTVKWPVLLQGRCGLNLVLKGRILRVQPGAAALRFQWYEFRTRGKAAAGPGG